MKIYLLLILVLTFSFSVLSQQLNDGIALYQKGEFAKAAESFQKVVERDKSAAVAWYYLGLTLYKTGNFKDSAKAFENAGKLIPQDARPLIGQAFVALSLGKVGDAQSKAEKALKLAPNDSDAYYVLISAQQQQGFYKSAKETVATALKINPERADFYRLKVNTLFSEAIAETRDGAPSPERRQRLFDESRKVFENYPNISAATPQAQAMREEIAAFKLFVDKFDTSALPPQPADPTVPPIPGTLKITSKPRANYTDAGRQNSEQGTVSSVVLFSADGTIGYVLPYKGLKYGLTQEVLTALTKVRFDPATENGKPVPTVRSLHYNFAVY